MIFSCSRGHVLTVDASRAGQQVRCPSCQEILVAPQAPAPPPVAILVGPPSLFATPPPLALPVPRVPALEITEFLTDQPVAAVAAPPPPYSFAADDGKMAGSATRDEQELAADFRAQRELQLQLRTVNLGLRLHYWKYTCITLSILLNMTGAIVASIHPWAGAVLVFLSFGTGIAGPLLGVIGSIRCNARIIPGNSRTLILTSMAMDLAALVVAVIGIVFMLLMLKTDLVVVGLALLGVSGVLDLVAFSLFMVFVSKLASYLGDNGVAQRAHDVMISFLITTVGGFLAIIILVIFLAALFYLTGAPLEFAVFAFYPADLAWIVIVSNALFQILHVIADLRKRVAET